MLVSIYHFSVIEIFVINIFTNKDVYRGSQACRQYDNERCEHTYRDAMHLKICQIDKLQFI